jgi:hypothetical protein
MRTTAAGELGSASSVAYARAVEVDTLRRVRVQEIGALRQRIPEQPFVKTVAGDAEVLAHWKAPFVST